MESIHVLRRVSNQLIVCETLANAPLPECAHALVYVNLHVALIETEHYLIDVELKVLGGEAVENALIRTL